MAPSQAAEDTASAPSPGAGEDAGRAKRRRRQPAKDHDLDLDNEDLKILQQAIDNSRAENVNVDVHIEECPVFYPTVEEFVDPIKYISSIMPRAIRFGICRIVPPEGWTNPTQVDFESKKKFATKLQRMSLMQEGRAMGDGQFKLELELILSRWLWERGEKGGASLQKQARMRALCGVMQ